MSIMEIHPSAVVSPHAELGSGVKIGPYCVIGEYVTIGRNTVIQSHSVIEGHTRIGERNRIYPFVCIGTPPQDTGYRGEDTRCRVGDDNLIREYATIHRATTKQDWETVVGNENYIMAYAHVAHDCYLGNGIIMSNAAMLSGHVTIHDQAILGGIVGVHQFVRIGTYAFIGGGSGVDRDMPPFMIAAGARAKLYGVNRTGLLRQGFSTETIDGLKRAFKIIWRDNKNLSEGVRQVKEEMEAFPELETLLNFLSESKRGTLR